MDQEYLIKKWLNGDLTAKENEAFKELDDYRLHKKIIDGAQYFKADSLEKPASLEAFYARMHTNKVSKKTKTINFASLLKIAASIAIIFGITTFFWLAKETTIQTAANQKSTVILPDDSQVALNSESTITFNKKNWNKRRAVQLEGEAFFKVAKGQTFDVKTTDGIVQVLGTQFNVKSRKDYFEVQCYEGLVLVKSEGLEKKLKAGDSYRKINTHQEQYKTTSVTPQWINNTSMFKSVPFGMVINEFERQYDVTISLKNVDKNRLFTGGFTHNNLNDGLKAITLPLDLSYQIDDNSKKINVFYPPTP